VSSATVMPLFPINHLSRLPKTALGMTNSPDRFMLTVISSHIASSLGPIFLTKIPSIIVSFAIVQNST
jgi:hypothetical protein